MTTDLVQINQMASAAAKSRLFPGIDTVDQAAALMLICSSEGIHPMKALQRYHIVKGRPTWKSQALLAAFKERGGSVSFTVRTDQVVTAIFKKDEESLEITWTTKMAQIAGLASKDVWQSYPRQMLTARVIAEGVNLLDPAISGGMATEEVARDLPDDDQPRRRNKPALVNSESFPLLENEELPREEVDQVLNLIDKAANLVELESVVKDQYKLVIQALPDDTKSEIQTAFTNKKKVLMFNNVPGVPTTLDSSKTLVAKHQEAIDTCTSLEELNNLKPIIEADQEKITAEDKDIIAKSYVQRIKIIQQVREEPAPTAITLQAIQELSKPEPNKELQVYLEKIKMAQTIEEVDAIKTESKYPFMEPKDAQAFAAACMKKKQELTPKPTYPDNDKQRSNFLELIAHIQSRAMADAAAKTLEQISGNIEPETHQALTIALAEVQAKYPKKTVTPLEQTVIPGMAKPQPIKMVYSKDEELPSWAVVGAKITVAATPGGKPFTSSEIETEPSFEKGSNQICVKTKGLQHAVPLSLCQPIAE